MIHRTFQKKMFCLKVFFDPLKPIHRKTLQLITIYPKIERTIETIVTFDLYSQCFISLVTFKTSKRHNFQQQTIRTRTDYQKECAPRKPRSNPTALINNYARLRLFIADYPVYEPSKTLYFTILMLKHCRSILDLWIKARNFGIAWHSVRWDQSRFWR